MFLGTWPAFKINFPWSPQLLHILMPYLSLILILKMAGCWYFSSRGARCGACVPILIPIIFWLAVLRLFVIVEFSHQSWPATPWTFPLTSSPFTLLSLLILLQFDCHLFPGAFVGMTRSSLPNSRPFVYFSLSLQVIIACDLWVSSHICLIKFSDP